MAEKSSWTYLRNNMKGRWAHANRHEDLLGVGIADVSYYSDGNSWIELKEVKKLPVRPGTGISLGQWHNNGGAQRHFLVKRRGWLLTRVNQPRREYLLFRYDNLPPWEKEKRWTYLQMVDASYYMWRNRIDFKTLAIFLEKPE